MNDKPTIDLDKVENIIFDLGGVILNINYKLTRKAFEALGVADFDSVYSQAKQDDVFDQFEKGIITEAEFRTALKKYLAQIVTDDELDQAWNAMLLDLPIKRLNLIKELSQNKRVFLLSNTNSIHIRAFNQILELEYGVDQFEKLFEKIYYSHILKMRKPDAEVFQFILKDAGIQAESTLFIDDSKQHIQGAKTCGINAIWLDQMDITELF